MSEKLDKNLADSVSRSTYLTEKPLNSYVVPFILGIIIYSFRAWILKKITKLSDELLIDFQPDLIINCSCLAAFIYVLILTVKKVYSKQLPTLLSVWYTAILLWIYICAVRLQPNLYFFKFFDLSFIYLSDVLLATTTLFLVSYAYRGDALLPDQSMSLVEDLPHTINPQSDPLTRYSYAGHIAEIVRSTVPKKAIAIAILSDWGYGKTSFLNSVKERLADENDIKNKANIIVDFNPWKFDKKEQLLNHFFDELDIAFDKYDNGLAANLRDYADKLTEAEDPSLLKLITQSLVRLFGKNKSLSERYEDLNRAIIRSGKRLIVFVDDLDRLMPDELVTMIRLIRNTADFNNTFFIVAFDEQYVINALANSGNIIKQENYLKKIFQLEVVLPPIDKKVVSKSLREYLYPGMNEDTINKFEEVLSSISKPEPKIDNYFKKPDIDNDGITYKVDVTDYLVNIRDVKRFANTLRISYSIIGNEVDLYDLISIELIKFTFPALYDRLSNQSLILDIYGGRSRWHFDENAFDQFFLESDVVPLEGLVNKKDIFKKTFQSLFDDSRKRTTRSIFYQDKFHLYFFYQLFGSISIQKLEQARNKGFDELTNYFHEIARQGNIDELLSYLERIPTYRSKEDFESFIKCAFMAACTYGVDLDRFNVLLSNINRIVKVYYKDNNSDYESFIYDLLKNKSYSSVKRAEEANFFLYNHLKKSTPLLLEEKRLKEILLEILKDTISNNSHTFDDIYNIYKYNWSHIEENDNRSIKRSDDANHVMRNYVYSYPLEYANYIFQQSTSYYEQSWIEIRPTVLEIFGDYPSFENFIDKMPISECKAFISKVFNIIKANEFRPVEIPDFKEINTCV